MKTRKSLITNNIVSAFYLLLVGFLFYFFFFPDKLNVRFQSVLPANLHDPLSVRLAKVAVWILVILILSRLYHTNFVKRKCSERVSGIGLSVLTTIIMLIFFEIGFMFFPQTHGVATTKASALWVDKYYKPVNSLGYRDKEPDLNTQKKVILFVGDSFTAGYGNDDVKDRFSDMFYSRLDTSVYEVYNLGVPGIDTRGEEKRLREFPLKPDVIILAYFFNDIEVAAAEHGFKVEVPMLYEGVPAPFRVLVDRLYFPNFIYWHLPGKDGGLLDQFLCKTYKDPVILQAHLDDLSRIIEYKEETRAWMITAMIPFLPDLDYSAQFTKPVADFLEKNGVTVVNFEEEIAQLAPAERIVNKTDSHSSVKTNEIIARKLLQVMQ